MSFFPHTPTEEWSTYGAIAATLLLWLAAHPRFYPQGIPSFDEKNDYHLKLMEWERERILGLAKGMAGAAVTYFAALIPIIFKGEIRIQVSPFTVIGIVIGFLGALALAANMNVATSQFTRTPGVFCPRPKKPRRWRMRRKSSPPPPAPPPGPGSQLLKFPGRPE
jgi:hypothetical protein